VGGGAKVGLVCDISQLEQIDEVVKEVEDLAGEAAPRKGVPGQAVATVLSATPIPLLTGPPPKVNTYA
jgi:hypothetical protein